jgi:hypothetical protein
MTIKENKMPEKWCEIHSKKFTLSNCPDCVQAVKICSLIDFLRSEEGDYIGIPCDNPDFGGPGCYVEVIGNWTQWETKRSVGDTLLQCLVQAAQSRKNFQEQSKSLDKNVNDGNISSLG